ncbi:hypothetical protein [uncultured Clostridium sp.]|uniref:hypothetical protein n=1 Tax=uncultured Clostridium sp. TaxID=59620 RepID=UPI0025E3E903|nr:hypothetical protein [uncultured Clostridium sp.]
MDRSEFLSELVEVSAKPIFQAKNYWHKSVYDTLETRKKAAGKIENYESTLKAGIVSMKKLWAKHLKMMEKWAQNGKIPGTDEMGKAIENIERESETEVSKGRVVFKNGDKLNGDELDFIERYSSIENLNERIIYMEEDYLYLRIRDYIILNLYQFLAQNEEMSNNILKWGAHGSIKELFDLISKYADRCMYTDLE